MSLDAGLFTLGVLLLWLGVEIIRGKSLRALFAYLWTKVRSGRTPDA